MPSVAVVGAGMSGSMCAHCLVDAGFRVTVFDKGRGPGGRTATRRLEGLSFDHGAQYFTTHDPGFRRFVDRWLADGLVAHWPDSLAVLRNREIAAVASEERFVGVPGMSAMAGDLLRDIPCEFETSVESAYRHAGAWHLALRGGKEAGPFDVLVLSAPPTQSVVMAAEAAQLAPQGQTVSMMPCWATVLGFPTPVDLPFDAAFVEESVLRWIARDSSKPGRSRDLDVWVLHASAEWSRLHLEQPSSVVQDVLLQAFVDATGLTGLSPQPLLTHRWRYARPEHSTDVGLLYDPSLAIGLCGDWLSDGRVEAAALSGWHLADRIIAGVAE